jgi:dTDP-glucose 4,6-dehydratase
VSRVVITGAAGFLGSHLTERFLTEGWEVVAVDNLVTGRAVNLEHLRDRSALTVIRADVSHGLSVDGPLDLVMHLASLASPPDYLRLPLETLRVGAAGTEAALDLATERGARFLMASTSEVYGDPLEHPQRETYWGNVNPVGPRSVYDESKRYGEAISMAYHRVHGLDVKLPRIFNTYGPRMRSDDGRAVPTFITQALHGEPLTVHGDGGQTRSLCYVDDLVEGIWRLSQSDHVGPMNLGSPEELKVLELAQLVCSLVDASPDIAFVDRPVDDPTVRCPDIALARDVLRWEPVVRLSEGLRRTIEWARGRW